MTYSATKKSSLIVLAIALLFSLILSLGEKQASAALPAIAYDATYKITSPYSGKVLDVNNAGWTNGTNVQIWGDNGTKAQAWQFVWITGNKYTILNRWNGMALDVNNAGTTDGTNVQIWSRNGSAAQVWELVDNGDGTVTIVNPNSNKALDAAAFGTADGTNAQIWTRNGAVNQKWKIEQVLPKNIGISGNKSYVYVTGDNIHSGQNIVIEASSSNTTDERSWIPVYTKFVGFEYGYQWKYEIPWSPGQYYRAVVYPGHVVSKVIWL